MKKPVKRPPKIKSPVYVKSPKRLPTPVKKSGTAIPAVKAQEKCPAAIKNPVTAENSLKRKDSLNRGTVPEAGLLHTRQRTEPSLKSRSASAVLGKDVGRKSLSAAVAKRSKTNNNQSDVINKNKPLTSQSDVLVRNKPLASQKERTVQSKSPAGLKPPEVKPRSARTSSVGNSLSLQDRRKSIGDLLKTSRLTSNKASPTTSVSNSLPRVATQPRRSLSHRESPAPASSSTSVTPTIPASNRRNSLERTTSFRSQIRRDSNSSLRKTESFNKVKSSRSELSKQVSSSKVKKSNSEERKHFKSVLDGNSLKFDVLAVVSTQLLQDNERLNKVIRANKLQLGNYKSELDMCKVSSFCILKVFS